MKKITVAVRKCA